MKAFFIPALLLLLFSCSKNQDQSNGGNSPTPPGSIPPPSQSPPGSPLPDLTDCYFVSPSEGIVTGSYGYMAKTTDAGKSWTEIITGQQVSFLSCQLLPDNSYIAARVGVYQGQNGSILSERGNLASQPNSIFDMHFFDSKQGIVLKGNLALRTNDAGSTWTESNLPAQYMRQIDFVQSQIGYVSGGITYDAQSRGNICKTIDGGQTWSNIHTANAEVMSLDFIDAHTGFYVDFNQSVYTTTDGGIRWTKAGEMPSLPLCFCFINSAIGFATTQQGEILKTTDAGRTWAVTYSKPNNPIAKIFAIQNTVYAVGNEGLFLKVN